VCVLFACHVCVFMSDIIGMSHISKTACFWCPNWFEETCVCVCTCVCGFVRGRRLVSEQERAMKREREGVCVRLRGEACVFVCAYVGI